MDKKPTINTNAPLESAKECVQTGAQQIASSIQQGIPPTNAQISEAIDTTTSFLEQSRHEGKVTGSAEKAISDVEKVLEDTKLFLEKKNPGDLIQKAVIHGTEAAACIGKETAEKAVTLPFKAAEYEGQAKTIFAASTSLVQQLVRSGEFRRMLLEFVDVIESSLWRVEKTAEGETKEAPSLTGALKKDIATVQHPTEEGLPATQQAASELADRIQRAVREEVTLTEDEKKRLRLRLSNVLKSMKSNPQFHVATQNLINMLGYLREEAIETLNAASGPGTSEFKYNWTKATYEAQKFLEGFTGGKTLQNLSGYIRNFMDDLAKDKKIDNLLEETKCILNAALENPQRLVDDQHFINRADNLMQNTRAWLRSMKKNDYLQGIADEARNVLEAIKEDPLRQKLVTDTQIMIQDFVTYDANNRAVLNLELVNQMKGLLVPLLKEHLRWVPLPRIEGSNETYDYWFDNVVFSAPDLVPDKIHVRMFTEGDFDINKLETDNFVTLIKFSEEGIKTTLKDVHFWFKRKTFPRVEDSGIATAEFTGDGIKMDIIIAVRAGTDRPFQVRRTNLHIDGLSVSIADTKHDFLYNAISTMFAPAIRARMEASLHETLDTIVSTINDQLNRIVVKTAHQIGSQFPLQTSSISQPTH